MSTLEEQIAKTRERFAVETRDHQMTVLLNQGIYRHLRFRGTKNYAYWFELITGPRFVLFRGDGDSYVFSNNDEDMFRSFRNGILRNGTIEPDPGYWTQKLASSEQAEKWDEDEFRNALEEMVTEYGNDGTVPPEHMGDFRKEVAYWIDGEDLSTPELAIKHMEDFHWRYDGHARPVLFEESWEWIAPCKSYDWWYLWALHAIPWGIQRFDEQFGRPGTQDVSRARDVATLG